MKLSEYQEKARVTRFEQTKGIHKGYSALGLSGEAGEVADKIKKIIRGDFELAHYDRKETRDAALEEHKMGIAKELGDVMWYLAAVADDLEMNLDAIAQANLDKLAARQQAGKLRGSGDNR